MPSAARTALEIEDRRRWFVQCAAALLDEKGYDRMSMDELAASAEFTKRTLYQHFGDKREIFLAVVLEDITAVSDRLEEAIDPERTGRENFLRMKRAFFAFAQDHPAAFGRIVDFEANDYHYKRTTEGLSPYGARCVEAHRRITERTVSLLEAGQRDASITSPHSAPELMLAIWAASLGAVQVLAMRRDRLRDQYQTTEQRMIAMCLRTIDLILTDREAPRALK